MNASPRLPLVSGVFLRYFGLIVLALAGSCLWRVNAADSRGNYAMPSLPAQRQTKHVFILNSFSRDYRWTNNMLQGIDDTLKLSGLKVDLCTRFMDMKRVPANDEYFEHLKNLIHTGYRGIQFDVVLACDNDAVEFLRKYRDTLFPGVPVVFASVNDFDMRMLDGRKDITGTSENTDYLGTLQLAMKLRPLATTAVIVTDQTTTGMAHHSAMEKLEPQFSGKLKFEYVSFGDYTLSELGEKLSRLTDDCVVLLLHHFRDRNGCSFTVDETTPYLTSYASVPCFVLTDIRIGLGALGGQVVSGYHHGKAAATMVLSVLNGRKIETIPVMLEGPNEAMFDLRVMRRFGISESAIPPESIILNKAPSLLVQYRVQIIGAGIAIFILCAILVFLTAQIRKRKNSEEALRQTAALLRSIIDSSPDLIFVKDASLRTMLCNNSFAKALGKGPEELYGKTDIENGWDPVMVKGDLRNGIRGFEADDRDALSGNTVRIAKEADGLGDDCRYFDTIKLPLRNGQGAIIGMLGISRDITERIRNAETLRIAESRLKTISKNFTAGMLYQVVTRHDGTRNFTYLSDSVRQLYGVSPEDVMADASLIYNRICEQDIEYLKGLEASAIQTLSTFRAEVRVADPSGEIRWSSFVSTPSLLDDGNICWDGVEFIITKTKQTEEALRQSEERLSIALDVGNAGIWEWDLAQDTVRLDDRFCAMLGYMPGELPTDVHAWIRNYHHPDEIPVMESKVHDYLSGKSGTFESEHRIRGKNGEWNWVFTRGKLVTLSTPGSSERLYGIAMNITERKQMTERLRQMEKMDAIGQLAGGIAHDFNNQLGCIVGYAEMLMRRLHDPNLLRFADSILNASLRSADLTRQLLAFARKGKYMTAPVDIHAIIHEVVILLQHSIDKRIGMTQHLNATVTTVIGDATQIQSALLNLAINARDAMPHGGEILFATDVVSLEEESCDCVIAGGPYIRVSITDTGAGMSREIQSHLFEPFFTTKEQGKGTGLGLAAVYGTVKNHHGAVTVYSEEGHGSTFKVYFPLLEDHANAPIRAVAERPELGALRILVVDDEEGARNILVDMLQELGCTSTVCCDGEEAVLRYQSLWPQIDLVILDMIMPRMGGRDTFIAMRAINPAIRALLSSGYSINGEAQMILDEGVRGFIQKPFCLAELTEKLAAASAP